VAGTPDPNDMWAGMSTGVTISAYLLSGLLFWGGIGFLVDWLAGTPKVFTAIGMIVGAASGTYLIYLRYGKEHDPKNAHGSHP
jgi:ATP synthase protein I